MVRKRLILILLIAFFFLMLGGSQNGSNAAGVRTSIVHNSPLMMINSKTWSLYRKPFSSQMAPINTTRRLNHKLIKIDRKKSYRHRIYFLIQFRNRVCGWIDSRGLSIPNSYVLPFRYCSQLFPLKAPEACEAASLKMALSAKGIGDDDGLQYIIDRMPESSNSNRGFSGNPYRDNSGWFYWWNMVKHGFNSIFGQTIYPKPLARYAREYDPNARNITGASKAKLIDEIIHGNAIVFVGTFQMQDTDQSYHVLSLVGYRHGQFLIADPYRYWGQHHSVFWISTRKFMKIFSNQLRQRRAIAV